LKDLRTPKTVYAVTLDDLWRESINLCVKDGIDYLVRGGSYVGQVRRQLQFFYGVVQKPWLRPLAPVPPPGIPASTTLEKIESYFLQYLMSEETQDNEEYTYGSFIYPQLDKCIGLLNDSDGRTNQACISVGDKLSVYLPDPPCLRNISFKVIPGAGKDYFQMVVYFRSWDLYAGLPENVGGLQMLKEYVLSHMEFPCEDGPMIVFSDGAHIYEQYNDIISSLCVHKIEYSKDILEEKERFEKENGV
jgi:thymidylate synthase